MSQQRENRDYINKIEIGFATTTLVLGMVCGLIPSLFLVGEGVKQFLFASFGSLSGIGFTRLLDGWLRDNSGVPSGSAIVDEKSNINQLLGCRLFHYYVSRHRDGYVWRLGVLDIPKYHKSGRIEIMVNYPEDDYSPHMFYVQVAAFEERVVLHIKDSLLNEPPDVCIFPAWLVSHQGREIGIGVLQTLDRSSIIAPQMLCIKPINSWDKAGSVTDAATVQLLNEEWRTKFPNTQDLVCVDAQKVLVKVT